MLSQSRVWRCGRAFYLKGRAASGALTRTRLQPRPIAYFVQAPGMPTPDFRLRAPALHRRVQFS